MSGTRRLIVGLGNPTPQYAATRHNVGFEVLDRLIGKGSFRSDGRAQALVADRRLRGRPVVLAKPQAFMNRSGSAVRSLAQRYSLQSEAIMVVVDDLNLPLGMIRVRAQGSAGGHNGLQDIIDHLETNAFARVRVGIGGEFERGQQSRYVLASFTIAELPVIEEAIGRAAEAVTAYVTDGITTAMNRFNRRAAKTTQPDPPSDQQTGTQGAPS